MERMLGGIFRLEHFNCRIKQMAQLHDAWAPERLAIVKSTHICQEPHLFLPQKSIIHKMLSLPTGKRIFLYNKWYAWQPSAHKDTVVRRKRRGASARQRQEGGRWWFCVRKMALQTTNNQLYITKWRRLIVCRPKKQSEEELPERNRRQETGPETNEKK